MGEIYALPKAVSNKISGEDVTPIYKITNSDINLMTHLQWEHPQFPTKIRRNEGMG